MKQLKLNKKLTKPMLYIILFFSATHIQAADWETIVKTPEYEILVDIDSFNVDKGLPYITANTAYKTTQNYQKNNVKFSYLTKHITTQFNCQTHIYKQLNRVYYNKNNTVVARAKGQASFNAIIPKSSIAALESLVCQVHKMVGGT